MYLISCCLSACCRAPDEMAQPTVESAPITDNANSTMMPTLAQLPTIIPMLSFTQTPTYTPRQKSIVEMMEIVSVVEEYHDDFGVYPASINDLIPAYLTELPFTNEGFEIKYNLDETRYIYMVMFWISNTHYCAYLRTDNEWECGFYAEP